MKKLLLITSLMAVTTTFAGTITLRGGYSVDVAKEVKTDKVKAINYGAINLEYSAPISVINDKMNVNFAIGGEGNVSYGSVYDNKEKTKETKLFPMYFGVYIVPTYEYMFNNDLSLRAGIKAGLGYQFVVVKNSTGLSNFGQTQTVIGTNFGANYKNVDFALDLGVKLIRPEEKIKARFNGGITIGYSFDVSEYGF